MAPNKKQQLCIVRESPTQVDACFCSATGWSGKCDQPDSTCRHRAILAGSGPQTVEKANNYDKRMTEANWGQLPDHCRKTVAKRRCPHKVTAPPETPDPELSDTAKHIATGDGPDAECEVAKKHLGVNVLGQPVQREPWVPPPDYEGPPNNNDRNYNVVGQRILRLPPPPTALPLSQLGADSKPNRAKGRYNVIGQRLLDPHQICIEDEEQDTRPYNVIGQPIFPPEPKPPPKQKPIDPLCLTNPRTV